MLPRKCVQNALTPGACTDQRVVIASRCWGTRKFEACECANCLRMDAKMGIAGIQFLGDASDARVARKVEDLALGSVHG